MYPKFLANAVLARGTVIICGDITELSSHLTSCKYCIVGMPDEGIELLQNLQPLFIFFSVRRGLWVRC